MCREKLFIIYSTLAVPSDVVSFYFFTEVAYSRQNKTYGERSSPYWMDELWEREKFKLCLADYRWIVDTFVVAQNAQAHTHTTYNAKRLCEFDSVKAAE